MEFSRQEYCGGLPFPTPGWNCWRSEKSQRAMSFGQLLTYQVKIFKPNHQTKYNPHPPYTVTPRKGARSEPHSPERPKQCGPQHPSRPMAHARGSLWTTTSRSPCAALGGAPGCSWFTVLQGPPGLYLYKIITTITAAIK